MITKIKELLKKPLSPHEKRWELSERIDEMVQIRDVLRFNDSIFIVGDSYTINPGGKPYFLNPTPEFKKIMTEYLNDRLIELAQEVQILQGVTPIEHLEYEYKDESEEK